jgi:hypothetical protein
MADKHLQARPNSELASRINDGVRLKNRVRDLNGSRRNNVQRASTSRRKISILLRNATKPSQLTKCIGNATSGAIRLLGDQS